MEKEKNMTTDEKGHKRKVCKKISMQLQNMQITPEFTGAEPR